MVDSNFSGYQGGNYYWNGKKVTEQRYRYEATRQQEAVLAQVNDLATKQAVDTLAVGAGFAQQEFGGLLRSVIPDLLDQYGMVNATAALDFYRQMADEWYQQNADISQSVSRDAARGQEARYAVAKTKAALALNKDPGKYQAVLAADYQTAAKSESVIGWTMKVRAQDGHAAALDVMQKAITREVASYHRDTILFNAALDPSVSRVQRVAQSGACEFCKLMALGSDRGKVRTTTYAAHFHNNCHCTIQPLFKGQPPIRPAYYDAFEEEYITAKSGWNGSNAGTKQMLANWREMDAAKANGTYAEELAKRQDFPAFMDQLVKTGQN